MCSKMVVNGGVFFSGAKESPIIDDRQTCLLPGFSSASVIKEPIDSNLSPFLANNVKPIQYGDTSIASICTDDPLWSAGKCLFLSQYEGRYRKRKIINTTMVNSFILSNLYLIYVFRILSELGMQRQEKELLEKNQEHTRNEKKPMIKKN